MFKRILVPTDGSPRAEHAARSAIELANYLDAAAIALYVYPPLRIYPTEPFVAVPELNSERSYAKAQRKAGKRHLRVIDEFAQEAGVRCASQSLEHDSPATTTNGCGRESRATSKKEIASAQAWSRPTAEFVIGARCLTRFGA